MVLLKIRCRKCGKRMYYTSLFGNVCLTCNANGGNGNDKRTVF